MTTKEERELVEKRVESLPSGVVFGTLSGIKLTKEQMLEEVRKGTPEGNLIIKQQLQHLQRLRGR